MILAIIFLITDLFMVGIAYAVYGRTAVAGYSDGMVLGVHIRREKQEDPVLVEFMKNYKKDVRKVYLGLGISVISVCDHFCLRSILRLFFGLECLCIFISCIIVIDDQAAVCFYSLRKLRRCYKSLPLFWNRAYFLFRPATHFDRSLCFIGSICSFYIIYDCITHIGCFPFCIDKSVFFRHGFRNCVWNGKIHVLIPAGKCVSESYRIFRLLDLCD